MHTGTPSANGLYVPNGQKHCKCSLSLDSNISSISLNHKKHQSCLNFIIFRHLKGKRRLLKGLILNIMGSIHKMNEMTDSTYSTINRKH